MEILLTFVVLAGVVLFFSTGWLRPDLVALLAAAIVAFVGLVTPEEAVAGFSNDAVIALAGMFVISAGLARTGVARYLGRQVLRLAGPRTIPLVLVLMLVSGILSGFINNIGVVAMMLPVSVGIARDANLPPSKLLIPMALGAQLGGLTTLIGTGPNLLAGDALAERGLEPLRLFDFTPIGGILLLTGTAFVTLVGLRLLPERSPERDRATYRGVGEEIELEERLFYIQMPLHSHLDGRTLERSLLGSAMGVHVVAVDRNGERHEAPPPGFVLRGGDRLLVYGRPNLLHAFQGRRHLTPEEEGSREPEAWLTAPGIELAEGPVGRDSPLRGHTLNELDIRHETGVVVVAVRRDEGLRRAHFQDLPLRPGDRLLLQGPPDRLERLAEDGFVESVESLPATDAVDRYNLRKRLAALRVTEESILAKRTLAESRLGDALGLTVLGVVRDGERYVPPEPDTELRAGDTLLTKAQPEDLQVLRGLQRLEADLDTPVERADLESDHAGFAEVVIAPRSELVGRTLRQVNFRGRFGATVLAVWREGGARRTDLRDEELHVGDTLVLYGRRDRLRKLEDNPELIVLTEAAEAPRTELAPLSILILAGALIPVAIGWLPISVAVLAGSALMILTRCVTPDEAYGSVDWPTVVLVAGLLALGQALENSGGAALLAEPMVELGTAMGPTALLAALCVLTILICLILPGVVAVVLLAPVAMAVAGELGIAPQGLVMGIALTGTTFASPVAHPAFLLVMAPAGYRLGDFLRVGIPLTILVLVLVVAFVPLFFPF